MHRHRIFVKLGEGVFGDLGSNKRVSVAIASDPGGKTEIRVGVFAFQIGRVPAGIGPGQLERPIKPDDHLGEGFGEIGEGVAKLFLDRRTLHENLAGVPESLEFGAQGIGNATTIVGVAFGGFKSTKLLVNRLVPDANGGPFGFSGVCGENGLDPDFFESGDGVSFGQAVLDKAVDDRWPEALDCFGAVGTATGTPETPGNSFLNNVQEFEANGEKLCALAFAARRDPLSRLFSFLPRNERAEFVVQRQGIGQHRGGFGKTFVQFTETSLKIALILDIVGHPAAMMLRIGGGRKDRSFFRGDLLLITVMKKITSLLCAVTGLGFAETTTVYVGTGKEGLFSLDLNEKTGEMTNRKQLVNGRGMGFQELNSDGTVIVSTYQKDGKGAVSSYKITKDGVEEVSVSTYEGRGLCHVSLDQTEKVLFGADYGGGQVVSFPVNQAKIGDVATLAKHKGSSVNEKRQSKPHAHSMYAGPANRFAYAPDLGIDLVKFYAFGADGKLTDKGGFKVPPGSGPRHMKFGRKGKFAYVLNELTLTVSVFSRNEKTGELVSMETVSVLPKGGDGGEMSCSEIRVSADGRFLYTANRDLRNEKRDSISVMSVGADGKVKLVETSPAKVWIPRNINLSPSGDWLLVAGQRSNEVTSHRIDKKTGKISFSGHSAEMPAAMCINFAK